MLSWTVVTTVLFLLTLDPIHLDLDLDLFALLWVQSTTTILI